MSVPVNHRATSLKSEDKNRNSQWKVLKPLTFYLYIEII